jgi:hypothetical protein
LNRHCCTLGGIDYLNKNRSVGEAHLQTSAMNNRDQIANDLVRFTLNNRLYFDQFPQHKKANGQ